MSSSALNVRPIGTNPTLIWGMTSTERLRRIAAAQSLGFSAEANGGPVLLAAASHVFEPAWLKFMAARPGQLLTLAGEPVIAHVAQDTGGGFPAGLAEVRAEDHRVFYNEALRKREEPVLERLEPGRVRAIERQTYFGAYKGVTDILTKYLWPEWALVLTRIAARLHLTPNMVTTIGAALCVLATWLFWEGHYWSGMAAGLGFMVLDTVDGKLARCTITSSYWGNIFDHGMDLVHPPFWWWAWGVGLGAWGLALSSESFTWVMIAIVGGYVVQRLIEGLFIRNFGGIHIHVWEKIDSDFRLITARRNPNMVILFVATLLQRPDIGLIAVAWWTVLSCLFHAVRLVQAMLRQARGETIGSWLTL
ncbi:CDP-alcohol phosphatidyltransferase family protein [Rhizorhabdus dicambivorans]|uniref:Phosphatidylglycerophosphate synthase n=1 Tax=Rhizorhabdus dicambivorans TaxID=1850238 RepID=A0A2A4FV23_9SPHN|nr:CDP-alcohol phosphatidyltransferase family protein [Rhizorhabdus dicambivorans]ATE64410.1 phosphatidylglycerophosphate synthase [Rhizorhabdus dicambivorans]PCE41241.1 phosphatidylglycerophosphate synthase [Rhizorhabdus dicambivorans]